MSEGYDNSFRAAGGRALGLDVGQRRIGVAVSDELGWTAQGVTVIERRSLREDVRRLAALAKQYGCARIVVGLPRRTDGRLGPEAQAVQAFGRQLESATGLPVEYWDERFSTAQARHTLLEAGVRRDRRRQVIDQLAASVILQAYLDRRRREAQQREEHAE
ncbi:MAG: Holliday junction DNA helicase RuvA [Firmicutes bacterium ZCTH02-B6]|nr:MAG: Holliday junction DNA helicase RuvA [Firmicutes bacterium ZCTH02-B6]